MWPIRYWIDHEIVALHYGRNSSVWSHVRRFAMNSVLTGSRMQSELNKISSGLIDRWLPVGGRNCAGKLQHGCEEIRQKKGRTLVLCHKQALLEQLANCRGPALTQNFTVLITFFFVKMGRGQSHCNSTIALHSRIVHNNNSILSMTTNSAMFYEY